MKNNNCSKVKSMSYCIISLSSNHVPIKRNYKYMLKNNKYFKMYTTWHDLIYHRLKSSHKRGIIILRPPLSYHMKIIVNNLGYSWILFWHVNIIYKVLCLLALKDCLLWSHLVVESRRFIYVTVCEPTKPKKRLLEIEGIFFKYYS